MAEPFLPTDVAPPDFYIAAMGRSGSTLLCNWLTRPPRRIVFMEPFFLRPGNSRLLRIQLERLGMPVTDEAWQPDPSEDARGRFARLMAPRLAGRSWALKEVLAEEHYRVIDELRPAKLVICVRDIVDVALSFFEKHRLQNNLDRFSDDWVTAYCIRESAELVRLRWEAERRRLPCHVVRYEDFTGNDETRRNLERFTGWKGGGNVAAGLRQYGRLFEVQRHGATISARILRRDQRILDDDQRRLAEVINRKCREYQDMFGYREELNKSLPSSDHQPNYFRRCRSADTPEPKLLANNRNT